jgi:hypothetical protein
MTLEVGYGPKELEGTLMTKDDYLRIARECGANEFQDGNFAWLFYETEIIAFASAIAALEREECAKVCYEHAMEAWDHEGGSLWCAAAIRNKEK